MPGYGNWKQLYKEEYFQLVQEGYEVTGGQEEKLKEILPFSNISEDVLSTEEEVYWKNAYMLLRGIVKKGVRENFPYQEPETLEEILADTVEMPRIIKLGENQYRERIAGAVIGRCAGVVLGKPLEMGLDRKKIQKYLKSVNQYPLDDFVKEYSEKENFWLREDCIPSTKGHIQYVQPDDDIHYTVLSLLLAETKGEEFTGEDIGKLWTENLPYQWFWCASRQAYYNYVNLESNEERENKIREFPDKYNPWRECIDGQIRSDLWGYLHPGEPEKAAKIAYKDCSFSLTKNGIYGGMFVAGCISAALSREPDVYQILQAGLAVIPRKCRLAEAVNNVIHWYQEKKDWIIVCDKIYHQYGELPFAAAINNLAIVTLALLHGNLDYTKTITTAVMCGIDTDCNAGTAGSIVGAAIGENKIPEKWSNPLNNTLKTAVASFGERKITELIDRIVCLKKRSEL